MHNVLVLCTGNSCRSQIAEGFLKKYIREAQLPWHVESAGIEAHGVNPLAIEVMAEAGVYITDQLSQSIDDLPDMTFNCVITVCDNAKENCPFFPGATRQIHHNFEDPAKATGSDDEILDAFRKVRDEIDKFASEFVDSLKSQVEP